jgi:hypothetical protein
LRKLEQAKARADADLASAEKAVANAKTDQSRAKAEERQQKAAAKAAELETQFNTAKADASSKLDAASTAKEAAKTAQTKKADTAKAALDAKLALEPVSIYISRATRRIYVRRNTHKPAPDGGGVVFDATIEARSRSAIPESRSARMCLLPWRAMTPACAGPPSQSKAGMTPRMRSTASRSRRKSSTASQPLHCRDPRSSSPTSR